jgi:hypothetical protein
MRNAGERNAEASVLVSTADRDFNNRPETGIDDRLLGGHKMRVACQLGNDVAGCRERRKVSICQR